MWFNIDLLILFLFLLANFIIGFGIRKEEADKIKLNDFKSYSLGNDRNPSLFSLTAAFTSVIITGGWFINLIQQSYVMGLPYIIKNVFIDPFAYILTALIFVVPLHKNTKRKNLSLNEWMDEKYHSTFLRGLMGFAETASSLGMLAIQLKAFGVLTRSLFNFSTQAENICIVCFALLLILYTLRGGFISIIMTDMLQFCTFMVAFVSLIVYITFKTNFFEGMWSRGVVDNPKMTLAPSFKDFNTAIFTLGIWVKTLFPKVNGNKYQRIMMSDDTKKVKKSLIFAACITSVFITFCVCLALLIYSQNPNLRMNEIIPYFVTNYCPVGLRGLLGAGLIAMSISTADSILNSDSVIITNDVMPWIYNIFSKKKYVPSIFTARIVTICIGTIGIFIALKATNIFSLLMSFGNFYHPIATVPSLILILGFNVRKESIISGVFCGVIATIIYYAFTGNISSFFLGILANLSGLLIMEFILRLTTKKSSTVPTQE